MLSACASNFRQSRAMVEGIAALGTKLLTPKGGSETRNGKQAPSSVKLILPQAIEPRCRHRGVARRVLQVAVTEIGGDRPAWSLGRQCALERPGSSQAFRYGRQNLRIWGTSGLQLQSALGTLAGCIKSAANPASNSVFSRGNASGVAGAVTKSAVDA